ncbi:MAG: acyltransferase family protein [Ilumatobacteraceae bacterium]
MEHRRDIEGLRALAVIAVIAYHAGVPLTGGGFVGVDVFLVISGFLITSLLLTEWDGSGRISLTRFYARRARRLLPISAAVLAATGLASVIWLEPTRLDELGVDILAASGFAVNLVLAGRGTDYLAAELAPSAIQHYWSLAVEEQFYVLWPALILIALRLGRRTAVGAVVALTAASALASALLTGPHPTWSYFGLHTRAWELGLGALLAVTLTATRRAPENLRAGLGWIGLVAIGIAIATFDRVEHFPGTWAALPVIGAALVLISGDDNPRGVARLLRLSPLQWAGSRSYSLYLWHWPALVIGAAAIGREPGPLATVALVATSIALAEIGFRLIENPIRRSPRLARRSGLSLTVGAGLLAVGAVVGLAVSNVDTTTRTGVIAAAPEPAPALPEVTEPEAEPPEGEPATVFSSANDEPTASVEATATTTTSTTSSTTVPPPTPADAIALDAIADALGARVVPDNLRPSLLEANRDTSPLYGTGCHQYLEERAAQGCVFGDPDGDITVAIWGDSHAAQWFSAIDLIAEQRGWRLVSITQGGCPVIDVLTWNRSGDAVFDHCAPWRDNVLDRFAEEEVDVVLLGQHYGLLDADSRGAVNASVWAEQLPALLDRVSETMTPIVLIDSPDPPEDVPTCLSEHPEEIEVCEPGAPGNTEAAVAATIREITAERGVGTIDPRPWLCVDDRCPVVVGDILVYRDSHHLSDTFVRWFTPVLDRAIGPYIDSLR